MKTDFKLDGLDRKILSLLSANARMSYLEVARECGVTGAAIHQRMQKMKEGGVVEGAQLRVSPKGLGYLTCAFIGLQINLTTSRTHEEVFERIKRIPEIVECHHISGKHSLLVKTYARSNEHLKKIIVEKIQSIAEVTSTETLISLEEGFTRALPVEKLA